MIRPTHALPLLALIVLAGCRTPGGAVHREVLVEFVTADSASAAKVVVAQCGGLPGETVTPSRSGDPNVHLDVSHASDYQIGVITQCLSGLQSARPELKIRDYRLDDGLGN